MTGSGRVTAAEPSTRFDVTLEASPISFARLAHSYPSLPLRGTMSGPLRVQGTTNALALATKLTGEAGMLAIDEVIDIDSTGGEGAQRNGARRRPGPRAAARPAIDPRDCSSSPR